MTDASQLTKPRPTQQTAAGSPLYANQFLQALAVTFQVGLFLFIGPLSLAFFVYLCYTDYYLVSLCYLCWYFWDIPTATNGGRSGPLVSWMRSWTIWKYNAAYYPVSLVKTAELDPKKNHLICCHPHGILCFGAVNAFGSDSCELTRLFPGILTRITTLQGTFLLPIFREFLLQAGAMAASRSSLETVLRKPGGGEAPVLMVGGVPEMMMACKPNEIQLHLSQRKGFVKMAIEAGATLVPCFVFGETETYNQSGPLAQVWNQLTCSMRNIIGIAPVFFSGAGWAQGSLGFLPRRGKLKVVLGKPMEFPQVSGPSSEDVDSAHKQYVAALASLYLKHNDDEQVSLVIT